jgi:hypothetical protein
MPEHSHLGAHEPGQDRHGARQPERFDPKRAARLDDRTRFEYLPPERLFALLKPRGRLVVGDWNGAIERSIGPHRDHVCTPAEARARLERAGLRVTEQPALPCHFVVTAERS